MNCQKPQDIIVLRKKYELLSNSLMFSCFKKKIQRKKGCGFAYNENLKVFNPANMKLCIVRIMAIGCLKLRDCFSSLSLLPPKISINKLYLHLLLYYYIDLNVFK